MDEPDRDARVLEDFYPDGPVEELESIYIEIVPDPLRVLFEFRGPDGEVFYRVFLGYQTFYKHLRQQLTVAHDLQSMMLSAEEPG